LFVNPIVVHAAREQSVMYRIKDTNFYHEVIMTNRIEKLLVITLAFTLFFCFHCERDTPKTIRIYGSTTIEPLMQKAANEFQKNRKVEISIQPIGSKNGIDSLIAGTCDIAMSSMEIMPEQSSKAEEKGIEIKPFLLGYDIIIPIVHPSNKISDIAMNDLKKVYDHSLTNWSELGGSDTLIDVVDRAHSSGTYNVWHHTVAPAKTADSQYTIKPSNSAVLAFVSEHTNAIGYVSATYLNPEVKPLKLDGISMAENNRLLSEYHLKRPIFLYVNEEKFVNEVKRFLIYMIISDRGKELLHEAGFFYNSWGENSNGHN
jgi:phosphate transport system substrate-binding protein